ncbi:MAG: hypothetical protein ACOCYB_02140 [Alkalispirochaeta sp.]
MSVAPLVCVSVTDFAMQVVHREMRLDHTVPLVIVLSEQPGARILECNRAAAACGVQPGMAYSHALSLSENVRAGTVSAEARRRADREIRTVLQRFSPAVEASDMVEGVYWLDISGMQRLFGGIGPWLRGVGRACAAAGWRIRVARGWTRPGTMLAAVREDAPVVFASIAAEHVWIRRQPLTALPLPERDQEHLSMVAFRRIGDLIDTPVSSIKARFSPRTVAFRQFCAHAFDPLPIQNGSGPVETTSVWRFEPPVMSRGPVQRALHALIERTVATLSERGEWIDVLVIGIDREREPPLEERIRCGHATRDVPYLVSLVDMRLDHVRLKRSFVTAVRVDVELSAGEFRQEEFSFVAGSQSRGGAVVSAPPPELLDRTIAALQAELGAAVCSQVVVVPGRFPEDRFALTPISHGRELLSRGPAGGIYEPARLVRVRRILAAHTADKPASSYSGPRRGGPFLVSSAWWEGASEDRVYEYRLQPDDREVWVYRLRPGGRETRWGHRFYLQGYVE